MATIRQKAARLIMTHISDRAWDDFGDECHRLERDIRELGVGGFCLFGGNVDRTPGLIEAMRDLAGHRLLVASDLERGLGQQLEGATVFPSLMMCGATGEPNLAFAQGCATAVEARVAGINLVFAPVADVHTEDENPIIGVRAFGTEPAMVAEFVTAFVRGLERGGVAATVKHFPGHGDTRRDSHIELPVVDADRGTLASRELVPFRSAFASGVHAVMTAHVEYPALDVGPATLSRSVVTGLLRRELGFDGLVVTDALLMGGITEHHGSGEAAVRAVEAGCDVLLMPADTEEAVRGVVDAVDAGRLTEERLDASITRIERALDWCDACPMPEPPYDVLPRELADALNCRLDGTEDDLWGENRSAVATEIAKRGATWLTGGPEVARSLIDGVDPGSVVLVALRDPRQLDNIVWLRSEFESRFPGARFETVTVGESVDPVQLARDADLCILSVFDEVAAWKGFTGPGAGARELARGLMERVSHTVVLLFAGPHTSGRFEGTADAVLCCYDGSPPAQIAAARALFGD